MLNLTRLVLGSALLLAATSASAQPFETIGSRALGMGGAFVAVADDASAAFWNPAGLASGQPAGATIEWSRLRVGDRDAKWQTRPVDRTTRFVSLGTWPIAVSILDVDEARVGGGDGKRGEWFSSRHYGLSLLQTLTEGVVVGTTLRYVRSKAAVGPVGTFFTEAALDEVRALPTQSSQSFDLDLSAMYDARVFRLGATVRNLRAPSLPAPGGESVVQFRESRVGLAILPKDGVTLAMDLDLEAVGGTGVRSRQVAAGTEIRVSRTVVVRAGARRNLEVPVADGWLATAGAGLAVRPGTWLDVHGAFGPGDTGRRLGVGLRAGW